MKNILMLLVATVLTISTYAQNWAKQGFGIKAGVQKTNYDKHIKTQSWWGGNNKLSTNYFVGVYQKIKVGKHNFVQIDAMYTQKGAKTTFQGSDQYNFNTNYVELSPTLNLAIMRKVSLGLGVYGAYLLSPVSNSYFYDMNDYSWPARKDWNFIKNWDFGGVGDIKVDLHGLQTGFRYSLGAMGVGRKYDVQKGYNNQTFGVYLEYTL